MRRAHLSAALVAALAISADASSQDDPPVRTETFDPMEIMGSRSHPHGVWLVGHSTTFRNLVAIRESFREELLESAEEIADETDGPPRGRDR